MPTTLEQPRPQDMQREFQAERPTTPERPESTETDLKQLTQQADNFVSNEEVRVVQAADQRIEKAPASVGLDQQKANSIFTVGGFADRIKQTKEKISALAKLAKDKIKGLATSQPEVIHFKDLVQPQTPEVPQVTTSSTAERLPAIAEQAAQIPDNQEQKIETEDAAEQKELRDLREYLQAEVFTKFDLTAESEQKAIAEAPENRREVLQRSFENTRASLETFYKMETVDGSIDSYAVDKAKKQLTYETLSPVLDESLKEIQPKLAELGIEVSPASVGFTAETATQDDLNSALSDLEYTISGKIRSAVEKEITDALLQKGEWQGITLATEEQQKDEAYMEERGNQLQRLEATAVRQAVEAVGYLKWYSKTKEKLDEPYTMRPDRPISEIPSVDANQFKVKKSKEDVTAMLESEAARAEKTNFLCVNIDANKLEKVLAQDGFRDIFSLDPTELEEMKRAIGRGDDFYMNQRKTIEQALGTYDQEKATVYGTYASENGIDDRKGGADMYGGIFLKLKPSTEAVFCEGDSMSGGNDIASAKLSKRGIYSSTHWAEAAQARQIAPEHAALVKGMNNAYKQIENQQGRGIGSFSYLEAHIKGLNLENVDNINIPENYATGLFQGTVEQGDYRAIIQKLQSDPKWKDKINIIANA